MDVIDRAIEIPDVTRSGMMLGENPGMAEGNPCIENVTITVSVEDE